MLKLKSYTCENCGGVLSVEKNQRVLDCPFCGNSFRAVSFHRNEVLRQAAANLKRQEFSAADEKYREILVDDPANFDALLGRIFYAARIPSASVLSGVKSASEHDMTRALKMLRTVPDYSSSAAGPYFRKLSELLEMAKRYRELHSQVAQIRRKNKTEYSKISDVQAEEAELQEAVPAIADIIGSVFIALFTNGKASDGAVGIVAIVLLFLMFLIYKLGAATGLLIFLGILAAIIVLGVISSKMVAKNYRKRVDVYRKETGANHTEFLQIDDEMRSLEQAYSEGYAELKRLRPSGGGAEVVPQEGPNKEKPEVFSEEKKQVFCSKCGGELSLDRERSLYTCKFCGVACGASLFIGDVLGKAQKALSIKEFEEAEICFSNNLMMHPDDFDSLLGRILAEGRWTSIEDFELKEETHIPPFRIKNLLARIEEAKAHAQESDQAVFTALEQLVNIVPSAEALAKESHIVSQNKRWFDERSKFYSIRQKIQHHLATRA